MKKWYKSKTILVGVGTTAAVITSIIAADPETAAEVQKYVALVLPILTVVLRKVTTKPLG